MRRRTLVRKTKYWTAYLLCLLVVRNYSTCCDILKNLINHSKEMICDGSTSINPQPSICVVMLWLIFDIISAQCITHNSITAFLLDPPKNTPAKKLGWIIYSKWCLVSFLLGMKLGWIPGSMPATCQPPPYPIHLSQPAGPNSDVCSQPGWDLPHPFQIYLSILDDSIQTIWPPPHLTPHTLYPSINPL